MGGWVYAFVTPSMPGVAKIGATTRNPSERLAEANASDTWRPPRPYVVSCAAPRRAARQYAPRVFRDHGARGARAPLAPRSAKRATASANRPAGGAARALANRRGVGYSGASCRAGSAHGRRRVNCARGSNTTTRMCLFARKTAAASLRRSIPLTRRPRRPCTPSCSARSSSAA
jgi:hypothetical protein